MYAIRSYYVNVLNPTLNFTAGSIASLPLKISKKHKPTIDTLVEENINISKTDWDSFETSWDFKRHPLLNYGVSIYSVITSYSIHYTKLYEAYDGKARKGGRKAEEICV